MTHIATKIDCDGNKCGACVFEMFRNGFELQHGILNFEGDQFEITGNIHDTPSEKGE